MDQSEFENLFSLEYMKNINTHQIPFPNAEEILLYIQAEGGMNFIVTHRGNKSLSQLLEYYEMAKYFDEKLTYEDYFPKKPDPASFLHIISKYELSKDHILAIGDRDLDIQAAINANIKFCYFNPEGKLHRLADLYIKIL